MKKLLITLGTLTLGANSALGVACGKNKSPNTQLDDLTSSTSLITKMLLLGKHENLNFNPTQMISNIYSPTASRFGLSTTFILDGTNQQINFSNQVNNFNNLNKARLPIEYFGTKTTSESVGTRQIMPQYFVQMYDREFYQNFNDQPESNSFDPNKTIINENNRDLLGYNVDLGSLSTYLTNAGFKYSGGDGNPADRGLSAPGTTENSAYSLTKNTDSLSLIDANDKLINFATTESTLSKTAGELGVLSRASQVFSIMSQVGNNEIGATNALQILNSLYRFVGGKVDTEKVSTGDPIASQLNVSGLNYPLSMFNNILHKYVIQSFAKSYQSFPAIENIVDNTMIDENLKFADALKLATEASDYTKPENSYLPNYGLDIGAAINILNSSKAITDNVLIDVNRSGYDFTKITIKEAIKIEETIKSILSQVPADQQTQLTNEVNKQTITEMSKLVNDALDGSMVKNAIKDEILDQFTTLFDSISSLYDQVGQNSFSPLRIALDTADLASTLFNNTDMVKQLQEIYNNTMSIGELAKDDITKLLSILGFANGAVTNGSPIDHVIKAFTDKNSIAYNDYQTVFFNEDISPFYVGINTKMTNVYNIALQYAVDNKYWNITNSKTADQGNTLSYTLEYNGMGDGSVSHFETKSNTDRLDPFKVGGTTYIDQKTGSMLTSDDTHPYFDSNFNVNQQYNGSIDEQLAYSGTGEISKRKEVNHKYDVTWTNLGSVIKPYWVISDIKSYVHAGEITNGVGSTTNGDWTQVYFKF